jgi:hypothetical protein
MAVLGINQIAFRTPDPTRLRLETGMPRAAHGR